MHDMAAGVVEHFPVERGGGKILMGFDPGDLVIIPLALFMGLGNAVFIPFGRVYELQGRLGRHRPAVDQRMRRQVIFLFTVDVIVAGVSDLQLFQDAHLFFGKRFVESVQVGGTDVSRDAVKPLEESILPPQSIIIEIDLRAVGYVRVDPDKRLHFFRILLRPDLHVV